jgi:hypothetical protein
MASRLNFVTTEIKHLADSITKASAIAPADAAKVVTKGAVNIKADARRRVTGIKHAPAYPLAIDFDPVHVNPIGASTTIGPDKDKRQGALGNILEFGTVKNAPIPHMAPAAEAEEPRFVKAMEDLSVKALGL